MDTQEIDYAQLWELQKRIAFPGKISRVTSYNNLFVKLEIPAFGPSNELIDEVYCSNNDPVFKQHDSVLVSLAKPPKKDRKADADLIGRIEHHELITKWVEAWKQQVLPLKKELENRCSAVDAEIEKRTREEIQAERARLHAKDEELQEKLSRYKENLTALQDDEQELRQRKEELEEQARFIELQRSEVEQFRREGGPEFMRLLHVARSANYQVQSIQPLEATRPPTDLLQKLEKALADQNYSVDTNVLYQFVLSSLTALLTGQFVVLTGATGVGKTSLVHRLAHLLGAGHDVIPVRPAWIDATDLLGFYNPQERRYQPTPFLDRVLQAQIYTDKDRPYFLVLDEMNLSRIENYGADFLAKLETAHSSKTLSANGANNTSITLYSDVLQQEQAQELLHLKEQLEGLRQENSEEKPNLQQELRRIEQCIVLLGNYQRYQPQLEIPRGLVLLGTMNIDETTHQLSPKVLDRSFVIQVPRPTLSTYIESKGTDASLLPVWELSLTMLRESLGTQQVANPLVDDMWQDIVEWQEHYLFPLGVHLSHRFRHLFVTYMKVASIFNNSQDNTLKHAVETLLLTKLLPRISFHNAEKAVGRQEKKRQLLQAWAEQELTNYKRVQSAVQQMLDQGDLVVQYWES